MIAFLLFVICDFKFDCFFSQVAFSNEIPTHTQKKK